ncbi:MAG: MarR family winged helix-turn-helix transcriptional regulator [Chitinophagaceae bacterium]
MGIEKDIQQTSFRNDYQKATINLIFTANWLQERVKNLVETADITPQQYNILRILRGSKTPLSTLQIRERMLDKMSDTSRLVERLIKKNLVYKNINATDKRLVDVTITEKGLELLSQLDDKVASLDLLIANISDNEVAILNNLLDKIRQPA